MPECGKTFSIQGSTLPSPADPIVIDVAPLATEEKSIEQHKLKPSPQAEDNTTGAPPKAKKRGRPACGKAESTKPIDGGLSGKKAKVY